MYNKDYCVICTKQVSKKEIWTDLGYFDNVICKKCKDTDEAKEELGLD